jgi:hypothetical protein
MQISSYNEGRDDNGDPVVLFFLFRRSNECIVALGTTSSLDSLQVLNNGQAGQGKGRVKGLTGRWDEGAWLLCPDWVLQEVIMQEENDQQGERIQVMRS